MKLLKEFDSRNKDFYDSITRREAVRGIIIKGDKVLLVYLNNTQEYKFPGGGVESLESLEDALFREVLEEVGYKITKIIKPFGYVDQKYTDIHDSNLGFFQRSYYYICEVGEQYYGLNLSENEKKYGFESVWVKLEDAIKINSLRMENNNVHPWTQRELYVLNYLLENTKLLKL